GAALVPRGKLRRERPARARRSYLGRQRVRRLLAASRAFFRRCRTQLRTAMARLDRTRRAAHRPAARHDPANPRAARESSDARGRVEPRRARADITAGVTCALPGLRRPRDALA